jgi:hypothetical protein
MDKYSQSEIQELVWNDSFRQWVQQPTPQLDDFWSQYKLENPDKSYVIDTAREIVLSISVKNKHIPANEIQQIVRNTRQILNAREEKITSEFSPLPWYYRQWFQIAAFALIAIGVRWIAPIKNSSEPNLVTYHSLVTSSKVSLVEQVNTSNKPLLLHLSDGSTVTLQKDSKISYNPDFTGTKREVYLTGEAFFKVVKDPARPFLVYANELVTKVLGTSFKVKAYETDRQVTVEVRTGKVSVFAGTELQNKEKAAHRELEGVILTPNQRMVFSRTEVRMLKSLVEQPVLTDAAESIQFNFEDKPVAEVLASLEKAYGVDIVYDEDIMRKCQLTASLTQKSLFEKLTIICTAIEARYEVIDGQIVIYSKE